MAAVAEATSTRIMRDYGVVVALVALLLLNVVAQPEVFLRPENLRNLLNQNATVGIVAVGMTLVVIGGGIDLSVGSMLAAAGAAAVLTVNRTVPGGEGMAVALGVLTAIGVGLLLGLVNGLLVAYARITAFIATLCGLVGFRSIALLLGEGGEIRSASATVLPALGQQGVALPFVSGAGGRPVELTWTILLFVLVAVAGHVLLEKTVFGRNVVAVGQNEQAAYLAGVDTQSVKAWTYVLSGFLVGLAAVFAAARMNSVPSAQMGSIMELDAIAAVAIGGTNLSGGSGRVWGTVAGVLILGLISTMLVARGVSPYWQGMVKGAVILIAVVLQFGRNRS